MVCSSFPKARIMSVTPQNRLLIYKASPYLPSALVNNVPDYEMEKVKAFCLCILSFSEVLHTLGIIIKDTRAYTVPLCAELIDTLRH